MKEKNVCKIHNWVEETAVAHLDSERSRKDIQRSGHRGILTLDWEAKMEAASSARETYVPPKSVGVRLRGAREELLEKHLAQKFSEKLHAERNPPIPKTDFSTTTQRDFQVKGFVPVGPQTDQGCSYNTEQAITFWSENYQQIQGVTAVRTPTVNFRKSSRFSRPIGDRMDESRP